MDSHPESFSFSSLPELLEELSTLVACESNRRNIHWLSITDLDNIFHAKHGVSITTAATAQGWSHDLKSLFRRPQRFSIYNIPHPQEFYIALRDAARPSDASKRQVSIRYRIKRPWRADGRLIRMLKAEGAREIPSEWSSPSRRKRRKHRKSPRTQTHLVTKIESAGDLEMVLIKITKILVTPGSPVEVMTLYNKFCEYYGPIKSVVRQVCPGIKLIDYLQTISALDVQPINGQWHVTLRDE